MANFDLSLKKYPMPTQKPEERVKNFGEVALGYSKELALKEAARCLNCKTPACVKGCPVNVQIPSFISELIKNGVDAAYKVISETSFLPAVCGRVCPQETQCEARCVRGIKGEPVAIGRLERFVADNASEKAVASKSDDLSAEKVKNENLCGIKVAVVGSGPAGLTCAADLAAAGLSVTVYEALHKAGGVLTYGIPEFRLPKSIVKKETDELKRLGVTFKTNEVVGKTVNVDELFAAGYKAVFIGSGAGLPKFMGIAGEQFKGVYSANEFLTRVNLMHAYSEDSDTPVRRGKKVAVVGGGNVAMDAARTALRLGAEKVYIVYRRSMEELPARREEVENAAEEGVEFLTLCNPVEITANFNADNPRDPENCTVNGIKCIKNELGAPDESGRRRPVEIAGSEFDISVDTVIMAIGTSPNPLIKNTTANLAVNARGGIIVDETGRTMRADVYAGGDAVTGAATVISAMGAGKVAAKAILDSLSKTE